MFAQQQGAKTSRALVERDLRQYFADTLQRTDLSRVDLEALGEGPAAKVAKLYYWVRVYDQKRVKVAEGAVRVATVDRKTFEVTHFIARRRVRSEPELLQKIFPLALHEPIYRLAEGR